jgi:hypothetical protein
MKPPALLCSNPTPVQLAHGREGVMGATQAWSRALFERLPALGGHIHCEDRILPFRAALGGGITYPNEPLVRYRTGGIPLTSLRAAPATSCGAAAFEVHRWLRDGFAQMQRDLEARPDLRVEPTLPSILAKQEALNAAPLALAAAPYRKPWSIAAEVLRDTRLPRRDRLRSGIMYLAPALWSLQLETRRRLRLL